MKLSLPLVLMITLFPFSKLFSQSWEKSFNADLPMAKSAKNGGMIISPAYGELMKLDSMGLKRNIFLHTLCFFTIFSGVNS